MGYIIYKEHGKTMMEKDTTHCRHCQAIIDKKQWAQDNGIWKCSSCDGPLCHTCTSVDAPRRLCDPWQRKIERQIKNARIWDRYAGREIDGAVLPVGIRRITPGLMNTLKARLHR